ncbi:MAG: hypothetical protein FWD28_00580 [Treponema sp.]|nr:hypothetical protein [Treponema sp.]
MKKILCFFILIFICNICFAETQPIIVRHNIEFSSGYSFYTIIEDGSYTINNGIPFNFSYNNFGEGYIGMEFSMGIIYLPRTVSTDGYGAVTIKNGNGNILLAMDMYVGYGGYLINKGRLKIPFSAGIHFNAFMWESSIIGILPYPSSYGIINITNPKLEYTEFNFGIGFNLGIQFDISYRLYLFGKFQGYFDFLNINETIISSRYNFSPSYGGERQIGEWRFGFSAAYGFSPQIGIGFRF